MIRFSLRSCIVVMSTAIMLLSCGLSSADERPNIVYILADDLGYGDLGCYGSELNATPNIDKLAASGIRLTDFHAASWCAPSRRALMTGCHPNRPWGKTQSRLASAVTIPEMLKASGYATLMLGKWHLGLGDGLHPLDQGFDYWLGTRGSNDWDGPPPNYESFRSAPETDWKTPLYVNRDNKGPIVSQSQFTGKYTEEATRLIRGHADSKKPFFLYLAHNMPHVPIFASAKFRGTSKNGVYGDVIAELDWSVGEIVRVLEETGLRKNTIVIFTSDNGPWSMFGKFGGVAGKLRGEKSTTWEGGEHVPCIVSWPERIKPAVSDEWMQNYDMYATLAAFAGTTVPQDHAIDSLNMADVLTSGRKSRRTKHPYFQQQPMAFRSGEFKLHLKTRERTRDPETGKRESSIAHDPGLLFDLSKDVAERTDIAAENPEIVERLTREFKETQDALKNWRRF